jgi:hypothetical protein
MIPKETSFAPIYDSGCCFGRELTDVKVNLLLNDDQAFNSYIKKGKSEIHWERKKVNHFELIEYIASIEDYIEFLKWQLKSIVEKFNEQRVAKLVFTVDEELVRIGNDKILPVERKELIVKLLNSRFRRLEEIYQSVK